MEQYKTPEIKRRQVLVYLGVGGFGAWPILATPGIPAERVQILREAFTQTMKDPDFLAEAKKAAGKSGRPAAKLSKRWRKKLSINRPKSSSG